VAADPRLRGQPGEDRPLAAKIHHPAPPRSTPPSPALSRRDIDLVAGSGAPTLSCARSRSGSFEVWNEPDGGFWYSAPNAAALENLYLSSRGDRRRRARIPSRRGRRASCQQCSPLAPISPPTYSIGIHLLRAQPGQDGRPRPLRAPGARRTRTRVGCRRTSPWWADRPGRSRLATRTGHPSAHGRRTSRRR